MGDRRERELRVSLSVLSPPGHPPTRLSQQALTLGCSGPTGEALDSSKRPVLPRRSQSEGTGQPRAKVINRASGGCGCGCCSGHFLSDSQRMQKDLFGQAMLLAGSPDVGKPLPG